MPSVALRSLVPGASTELVERARATVERAIKQHKVGAREIWWCIHPCSIKDSVNNNNMT